MSKSKIFNDPVYGFITVSDPLILQLIDHPYFQRLSRITQLGLSYTVYPGAHHTRFHHALGAMHLMKQALESLRLKEVSISNEEFRAAQISILLHDVGHGPYSHTLEHSIMEGISHEALSLQIMHLLNEELKGELSLAIEIFTGKYHRPFFHQLVSSQLDTDRLDYLMRDSFYTGVAEGVIGSERIIKMMNVVNDQLVIEEKGIYSIEKFLIARRLMYWQVYLHKTVISAEMLLTLIMQRAKELVQRGMPLFCTSTLKYFLTNPFSTGKDSVDIFARLDDYDVMASVKEWTVSEDKILRLQCQRLVSRSLLKSSWTLEPPTQEFIEAIRESIETKYQISSQEAGYLMKTDLVQQLPYDAAKGEIMVLMKNGLMKNIFEASDNLSRDNLSKVVSKYIICYPKETNLLI